MSSNKINKKTIEELEGDYWKEQSVPLTPLIKDIFLLRKKHLKDFDSNDIRILLTQGIGVKYIIPKALEKLKKNILEDSFFYPGDLLLAVLNIDKDYWINNESEKKTFVSVLIKSKPTIYHANIINHEIKKELIDFIDKFIQSGADIQGGK